ncbi:hypothetical protein Krac_10084 [Ktedonobacter racemifer DSM 44963]|uniref:Uncharacterized protein n=1 Tax=Ktedonobacter racemifer DSM 44963 TaxID=485913 RepID=D6TFC8_KTERA|nr:hypothetical protein Krac_10084 [Ktedonobacter racemifer DSM 44963]
MFSLPPLHDERTFFYKKLRIVTLLHGKEHSSYFYQNITHPLFSSKCKQYPQSNYFNYKYFPSRQYLTYVLTETYIEQQILSPYAYDNCLLKNCFKTILGFILLFAQMLQFLQFLINCMLTDNPVLYSYWES